MYAVSFDIDTNCLNKHYPQETYQNAYNDIRKFMENNGFEWQQGSVYFGHITQRHQSTASHKLRASSIKI